MGKLKGITVILHEKREIGRDGFNNPVFKEEPVEVKNVLVAPATSDDIVTSTDIYGKKAVYTLAIPKGDDHDWENATVEFFNQKFRTFGKPLKGIDELIPLQWNMKVQVELYG